MHFGEALDNEIFQCGSNGKYAENFVETCKRDDEGINGQGKLNFSRQVAHGFDKHFLIQIVDVTRECHHMFVMRIALFKCCRAWIHHKHGFRSTPPT